METIVFSGFARNSRNVLWFQKDTIARFQLIENYFARPQIVAIVKGEDREVQAVFLEENIRLLRATLLENEQKEKLRRIITTRNFNFTCFVFRCSSFFIVWLLDV